MRVIVVSIIILASLAASACGGGSWENGGYFYKLFNPQNTTTLGYYPALRDADQHRYEKFGRSVSLMEEDFS